MGDTQELVLGSTLRSDGLGDVENIPLGESTRAPLNMTGIQRKDEPAVDGAGGEGQLFTTTFSK